MPFTFAHPAIVLPLLNKHSKYRKLFSATGLIVGSMTPDFESFILVTDTKIYGHSWSGSMWFDIPLGIALMFIFHLLVRDALIDNLPRPLEERFAQYKGFKWTAYFRENSGMILISLFIGIFSHLLWDAFTHLNLRYPDARYSRVMAFGRRLYIILQYGCSVIGLIAVAWAVYKVPRVKIIVHNNVKYIYWTILVLLSVLIGIILVTVVYKDVHVWAILLLYIYISSGLGGLIAVSLLYKFVFKKEIH